MSQVFNPREHLMQIKNKQGATDYLPVQWRLVWFRQECPEGTIETEIVHLDIDKDTEEDVFVWSNEKRRSEKVTKTAQGIAIVRATIKDGKGGIATGTKMEKAAAFPDYLEKAETGAIGRALAALGFGTQFAPELNEEHRIVDSPVERQNGQQTAQTVQASVTTPAAQSASQSVDMATEQQISSIRKLCEHLGRKEPDNLTKISYLAAKQTIQDLTTAYKESRQQKSA